MKTTLDYANRQVDIEMLQTTIAPAAIVPVTLTITRTTTRNVTGAQKLVQRYALMFLTGQGEVHFDQAQGTAFVAALLSGTLNDGGALQAAFAAANVLVLRALNADDTNTDFGSQPDDERLVSATLEDYSIDYATATVSLTISLLTAAGDTITFVLPTSVPR